MVERVSKEIRHEPPCHKYGRRLDDENRAIVTITRKPTETRTNHLRRQARVSSFALCLPLCISTIIVYWFAREALTVTITAKRSVKPYESAFTLSSMLFSIYI
jgi:hypothetical protein